MARHSDRHDTASREGGFGATVAGAVTSELMAAYSLFHGTPGERAGERGERRVELEAQTIWRRLSSHCFSSPRAPKPLSPALSPAYREEEAKAPAPRRLAV